MRKRAFSDRLTEIALSYEPNDSSECSSSETYLFFVQATYAGYTQFCSYVCLHMFSLRCEMYIVSRIVVRCFCVFTPCSNVYSFASWPVTVLLDCMYALSEQPNNVYTSLYVVLSSFSRCKLRVLQFRDHREISCRTDALRYAVNWQYIR
jgi:hypothetical protein